MNDSKPVLLISASDSSGAAGMQMDLRVLDYLGMPARCAITAVTVQGDGGARSINPVDPAAVIDAVQTALSDSPGIGAVKVGLLGAAVTAESLEEPLSLLKASKIPVIVDPVVRSTPGSILSSDATTRALFERILPGTTLLTPNRAELEILALMAGASAKDDEAAKAAVLLGRGAGAVLVTGGDTMKEECTDILYEGANQVTVLTHPRIGSKAPRGTGCALSTSIAARMARGVPLKDAVRESIEQVTRMIENAREVGKQLMLLPGTAG